MDFELEMLLLRDDVHESPLPDERSHPMGCLRILNSRCPYYLVTLMSRPRPLPVDFELEMPLYLVTLISRPYQMSEAPHGLQPMLSDQSDQLYEIPIQIR
jgi:hypothetical protein